MSREYVLQPFRPGVDLQIDYARELNAQQHAAVVAPPGPSLVIAGAGSGKTRTLTYRVAYLLEQGVTPDRILLLTFTNKAAKEMMRRVTDLLGREVPELWGGTFHSIANRILRLHADRLGFRRGFTILDREDARDVIKAAMGDVAIDVKATRFPKAEVLSDLFGLAGNRRISVEEMLERDFDYLAHLASQISKVRARYAERKREANAMDFDDLLLFWIQLLTDHPDMAEHYQRRFQFILVDEYLDTNKLQGDLMKFAKKEN
jgi:DNA helicase-2/ATP-dependent DNA helicase PcrA